MTSPTSVTDVTVHISVQIRITCNDNMYSFPIRAPAQNSHLVQFRIGPFVIRIVLAEIVYGSPLMYSRWVLFVHV